jgi:hypothetical protein
MGAANTHKGSTKANKRDKLKNMVVYSSGGMRGKRRDKAKPTKERGEQEAF